MPRELTLEASEIVHPAVIDGRTLWVSPEIEDMIHKLHHGDPTLGWEGDPRLALYRVNDRWVLYRLEHDNEYRVVCVSAAEQRLDERLIQRLVEHDHRRGFDPVAVAAQEYDRQADPAGEERLAEAMEKVVYGLRKDVGHHY